MSTHGVFVLRDRNYIWGFHIQSDGYNVSEFYEKFKHLTDANLIFRRACEFFADSDYDDCQGINLYRKKFDPTENYSSITEYTCYFDGKAWHKDWEE